MCLSTARYHLPQHSEKPSLAPHLSPCLSSAAQPPAPTAQQRLVPTPAPPPPETRPRLLSLSSRDCPAPRPGLPGPPVVRPGPFPGSPHTHSIFPTSGWCRRWRRVPRQREPYKMATAARASAPPSAFSRASSRTRECALPASPPSRRSGATNPAAAHKWTPLCGGGVIVVTALQRGGQPAPSPG